REAALREIARINQAARILAQVERAVSELSSALVATRANERSLQRCLERNPILFGAEYVRIIPKHRLGSEYEMDFALERLDGLVDLVEIEASTRPLFTKAGDPSKYLVHAEQQALDWLEWVEHNSPYAREKLPGLATPIAFVVIGRSSSLDAVTAKRLRRRNVELGRRVRIQTYDDLLAGARNLLKMLEGEYESTPRG
ncbi:MAG TPA: Shedu anti-phage system protein SduA domain-containing protein, partial [Thermoanaerobaculia bacterium]|nr:Shedu anti-phage system protein SduA domain-containing protein [Thermoanaerobaculia bacterium]